MLLYLAGPAVPDIFETLSDTGEAKDFKIAHEKVQIKKKKWPKRKPQSNTQRKQTKQSPCNKL